MIQRLLAWGTLATAALWSTSARTWCAEPKSAAKSLIAFEEFAKDYRCPDWFRNAKFGLWAHWGPQSVVGTANHHDHFDCFASTHHPWNSVNMGPKRDIIGQWRQAAARHGLHFGVTSHDNRHWSWWLPAFGSDKSGPRQGVPYDGRLTKADGKGKWWEGYDPADLYGPPPEKRTPELERQMQQNWEQRHLELVEKYQPDLLYYDGHDFSYGEHGKRVVERLYNDSFRRHGSLQAVCTIKSRHPGWVWDIEKGGSDKLESEPWQTDTTLGSHWFYKEDDPPAHNARAVIGSLVDIVSKNGNLLMNVELYPDGSIPEPQRVILEDVGAWLGINGEAIYDTRPWKVFGQVAAREGSAAAGRHDFNERTVKSAPYASDEVRFTTRGPSLYAIVLNPRSRRLLICPLGLAAETKPGRIRRVDLLGQRGEILFQQSSEGLTVTLPDRLPTACAAALRIEGVTR